MKHGLSASEARRQALVQFGGVEQAKEQQRAARGIPWLDIALQDLRYSLRTMRRDYMFTLVAAAILCDAGRCVCRLGTASGFAWNLWRDFVFGEPPDAGDRDSDGAGRCGCAGWISAGTASVAD